MQFRRPDWSGFREAFAAAFVAAALVATLRGAVDAFERAPRDITAFGDLRAPYCAARVAHAGADPYRSEPLGSCERATASLRNSDFLTPAPVPGFDVALFLPVSLVPFRLAAAAWVTGLALVYLATSVLLARTAGWSLLGALTILVPLGLCAPVALAQIVPLSVFLLLLAAWCVQRGHDGRAAVCASVATIEPHLALFTCVALFVVRPRTRPVLILSALLLGALSVGTVGLGATTEYATKVVPAQIAAEARFDDQYSLTYALSWLHLSPNAAIGIGTASYWIAGIAGVFVARSIYRRSADGRYLVFVPMAFSVVLGPYVHVEQVLAAVPLGALLVSGYAGSRRAVAAIALAAVAYPSKMVLSALRVPGMATIVSEGRIGAGSAIVRPELAASSWAERIAPLSGHLPALLTKIPTWCGLLAIVLLVAVRSARGGRHAAASAIAGPSSSLSVRHFADPPAL